MERLRVITRSLHLLLVGLGELWRRRWSLPVPLHGHRPDPAHRPHRPLLPQGVGGLGGFGLVGLPIQINHPLNVTACKASTHYLGIVLLADMSIQYEEKLNHCRKNVLKSRQGHQRMGAWSSSGAGARKGPWKEPQESHNLCLQIQARVHNSIMKRNVSGIFPTYSHLFEGVPNTRTLLRI